MTEEVKTEAARHRAQMPDGSEAEVIERITFRRSRYADGSNSQWMRDLSEFWLGSTRLTPAEAGNWQTVERVPRRLIRLT